MVRGIISYTTVCFNYYISHQIGQFSVQILTQEGENYHINSGDLREILYSILTTRVNVR